MELKIEQLPVSALKPYERNTRKHTAKDVGKIAESIKLYGFNDPIGIWGPECLVVEGHGRLQAAQLLGLETVPVVRLDHLSEDQRREYAIAHNRIAELSSWDRDLLKLELQGLDLSTFGLGVDPQDGFQASEDVHNLKPPKKPRAEYGSKWKLGGGVRFWSAIVRTRKRWLPWWGTPGSTFC